MINQLLFTLSFLIPFLIIPFYSNSSEDFELITVRAEFTGVRMATLCNGKLQVVPGFEKYIVLEDGKITSSIDSYIERSISDCTNKIEPSHIVMK